MASYDHLRARPVAGAAEWRQIAISAAGPLAGFLLAALDLALVWASGHTVVYEVGVPYGLIAGTDSVIWTPYFSHFINQLLFVTIVYGILNLLPVYPLDGGQIAREIFAPDPRRRRHATIADLLDGRRGRYCRVSAAKWHEIFLAIFFGYLAYASFATLQAYSDRPSVVKRNFLRLGLARIRRNGKTYLHRASAELPTVGSVSSRPERNS